MAGCTQITSDKIFVIARASFAKMLLSSGLGRRLDEVVVLLRKLAVAAVVAMRRHWPPAQGFTPGIY